MALGGRVELLLQHALVRRADGPLRPAVHAPMDLLRGPEAVLGHGGAHAARDALLAQGDLVAVVGALAPLSRAVRVAHGHAHDRDRIGDARDRRDTGDPAPGADDPPPADLLAQDAVRAADVVRALGSDRRRLETE